MKNHYVYITTDANRVFLEAGYCQDINQQLYELQAASSHFMRSATRFTRIVHTEEFETYEEAQKRKNELNNFTRMQKEKLIRRKNPNWLSISTNFNNMQNKKAAVYA